MRNSITWEQKARISALRAACASFFPREPASSDTDEERTARILDRAGVFHSWLAQRQCEASVRASSDPEDGERCSVLARADSIYCGDHAWEYPEPAPFGTPTPTTWNGGPDPFSHLTQADVDDYHDSQNDAIQLGTE
jgi:hypothetical protein